LSAARKPAIQKRKLNGLKWLPLKFGYKEVRLALMISPKNIAAVNVKVPGVKIIARSY
jgi:hypothetical protein